MKKYPDFQTTVLAGCLFISLQFAVEGNAQSNSAVAYWRFEEGEPNAPASNSILDSSGNGLHGIPLGALTYRTNVAENPIPNNASSNSLTLEFDGACGTRILVPDNILFRLTNSLTLEAYINPRSAPPPGTQWQVLFRGDSRPGLDPYSIDLWNGRIRFIINDAAGGSAGVDAPMPETNQWTHVAGTLDGSTGQMRLFINGMLAASALTGVRPFANLDPTLSPGVSIGNYTTSHCGPFAGLIDEVRVSNRALRAREFLNGGELVVFIGVSEVQVCWKALSASRYQAQYRSELTTNIWRNLGMPVMGSGLTNCVSDRAPLGEPQRYYRVIELP